MPLYSRSVPRATRASTDTFKLPDSVRPSCSRRVASVAFEFQTPCPSPLDPLFFVPEHNIRSPFPSRLILIITALNLPLQARFALWWSSCITIYMLWFL
jgi:hypothetical protein